MTEPNTPQEALYQIADALREMASTVANGNRRGTSPITRDDLQDILLQLAEKLEA